MFAQLDKKEKLAYTALASIALFGLSYVGARKLRPAAPVTIQELPAPASTSSEPAKAESASIVVVDVEGEVARPGVYRLDSGARVTDAIAAAGGTLPDASTSALNLAAKLRDGDKLSIPRAGDPSPVGTSTMPQTLPEAPPAEAQQEALKPPRAHRTAKQMPPPGSIDLNQASAEELETIPGIGAATAAKILELRKEKGRLNSVDDLSVIRGLSGKRLEQIRPAFRL